MKQIFPGVWKDGNRLLTRNLAPGFRSYTEQLVIIDDIEYRVWDPNRSKAAAAIAKGIKAWPLRPGQKVLYLGPAQGYTPSFFSDILGKDGVVYGVEISPRAMHDLNPVAEKRGNIVPILADARKPKEYGWIEPVDILYQDVATSDQPEILIRNAEAKLKPGGFAMIAIKSRSMDVTKPPKQVYREALERLKPHFDILEKKELDPYEKDHMLAVMRSKRP